MVEGPRRAAKALPGAPLDRVDVGVERPELRAPRWSRRARRSTGRGSRRRAARPGPRGRCDSTGDERGPEAGGHQRREPGPSGRELGEGRRGRPPGPELGRLSARAAGRRGLVVSMRVAVLHHAERRPAPRGWPRRRCRRATPGPRRARRAPRGPRPAGAADRRPRWRPPHRRPATRGSRARAASDRARRPGGPTRRRRGPHGPARPAPPRPYGAWRRSPRRVSSGLSS